jgi:hypothetical protein
LPESCREANQGTSLNGLKLWRIKIYLSKYQVENELLSPVALGHPGVDLKMILYPGLRRARKIRQNQSHQRRIPR